mmetsp:Transcript_40213/g.29658  ORF Transcript_40213/g.29658 Transcript_40213/m.29658 type:complete len:82 (-) Transcript_40213:9-254(-)
MALKSQADSESLKSEEQLFDEFEDLLKFFDLHFIEVYKALKKYIKSGRLQKDDILKAFSDNFKFGLTREHEKFVASFEKKF